MHKWSTVTILVIDVMKWPKRCERQLPLAEWKKADPAGSGWPTDESEAERTSTFGELDDRFGIGFKLFHFTCTMMVTEHREVADGHLGEDD